MIESYQPDPLGFSVSDWMRTGVERPVQVWINGREEPLMYPSVFFRSGDLLPKLEVSAMELARGKVLDVGAGAGCHSLELVSKGLDVVSVERSGLLCDAMKNRGLTNVVHTDIMKYSMGKFDTILLLMNGFGIAGKEDHVLPFLVHLKSLLHEGGQIIGESTDIFYMLSQHAAHGEIDLTQGYYGEVRFKLRYQSLLSEFSWIYLDEFLLEAIANEAGLKFEILDRGPDFNFLCRLYV